MSVLSKSTEVVANNVAEVQLPQGFTDKHVKILNENGTLTILGERTTKGKVTGIKKYHHFAVSFTDPSLEGANVSIKDDKVVIEPKKE